MRDLTNEEIRPMAGGSVTPSIPGPVRPAIPSEISLPILQNPIEADYPVREIIASAILSGTSV